MKKFGLVFLSLLFLLGLCSCSGNNPVIDSLPAYKSKSFYTSDGFQDYTDYAKYTYEAVTPQDLKASKYFKAVTTEDVKEILLYIADFEEAVETIGGDLKKNYDFDKSVLSAGDYFYIESKEGERIDEVTYGKFDNYTVYYLDMDAQVLYYFHNNI